MAETRVRRPTPDVYQAASANGFTDLVAAVDAAGLKTTLEDGNGHYKVFAPTNAAFDSAAVQLGFSSLVPPSLLNVVQMASLNPNFTTLVGAVKSAGLASTLSGAGPFAVFAPTNDAFAAIPSTVASLSTAQLTTVLEYHVLAQAVAAADIPFGQPIATVANQDITINAGTPPTIVDTTATPARVVATDVKASNGIIHVIDKVLIPALQAG